MDNLGEFSDQYLKYLALLAKEYPTTQATYTEIINLQAITNLPKGTEHFMSDLHGEYEAFFHILNNCSGVIREKVEMIFDEILSPAEQADLLTLVYYPQEKLSMLQRDHKDTAGWYNVTLRQLIELAKFLSSKYTRSKVRKAMPPEYRFIIDELLHAQPDEDNNRMGYHKKILDSIIETGSAGDFIFALAALIKRLAVDHLHIVGDMFDRGSHADKIIDMLMQYHSLDIEWGNHDVLWMGAAAGSEACIANVLRNNIRYNNLEILESGYGISLRNLALFARETYHKDDGIDPVVKAISVILFKLEGQIILRRPEYHMSDRLFLDKMDLEHSTVVIDNQKYLLKTNDFPTVDAADPYALSEREQQIVTELQTAFRNSQRLQKHIRFLYSQGSIYRCYNQNLLFHGCVPLDADGNFAQIIYHGKVYQGKSYMDYVDRMARRAYSSRDAESLDFMWYLWNGNKSPVTGRVVKTFERAFVIDENTWKEPQDPYYTFYKTEKTCAMILHDFGLFSEQSHIINGHTPVKVVKGESPIRAHGKLLVIDGGFCRAYQTTTGIAGYTLIFNSHGMRIKSHKPFESVKKVLEQNVDIDSVTEQVELEPQRVMIGDTDNGKKIKEKIRDLNSLLFAYRNGLLQEQ
jgi:fructose-1,6-bisphosphatase-3